MILQDYLDDLVTLAGVQGALVSLRNGLMAASSFKESADNSALAAMTVAVFDAMNRHFGEAGLGTVVDTIVETNKYSVQMMGLDELVLIVLAQKGMDIKETRLHMRRIAKALAGRGK